MSRFMLYLVIKCDDFRRFCDSFNGVAGVVAGITGVLWFVVISATALVCDAKGILPPIKLLGLLKISIIVCVCSAALGFIFNGLKYLIPSTKEMAVLLIVPPMTNAVVNSKELQQIPKKLLDLANDWLDKLSPDKAETQND